MKNFMFFICSLLLGACSDGIVDIPPVVQVKLNVTVSSSIVHVGDVVKVTCTTEGADRTDNNIGASTGTSWTYDLVIQGKTKIVINAFGAGAPVNYETTVDVYPVIVLTANDTLRAHGWKLVKEERWRISTNTIISRFELSAVDLSDVYFYTADGYCRVYHAGQTTSYAGAKYTLVGKILTDGDQVFTLTLLNDLKLQFEQVDRYTVDQVIKYFYEKV